MSKKEFKLSEKEIAIDDDLGLMIKSSDIKEFIKRENKLIYNFLLGKIDIDLVLELNEQRNELLGDLEWQKK